MLRSLGKDGNEASRSQVDRHVNPPYAGKISYRKTAASLNLPKPTLQDGPSLLQRRENKVLLSQASSPEVSLSVGKSVEFSFQCCTFL